MVRTAAPLAKSPWVSAFLVTAMLQRAEQEELGIDQPLPEETFAETSASCMPVSGQDVRRGMKNSGFPWHGHGSPRVLPEACGEWDPQQLLALLGLPTSSYVLVVLEPFKRSRRN